MPDEPPVGGRYHSDPQLLARARELRRMQTPAEAKLWAVLRGRHLGYKFRRQHPLGHFVADFYCAAVQLVIELDGDSHAAQVAYDAQRTAWLEAHGLRVLRFSNSDVAHNLEGVVTAILQACGAIAEGDLP